MNKIPLAVAAIGVLATQASAQRPVVHSLPATPATVAYGYYWFDAKPVLRISSGDIIDVETLLTNTPNRLEAAGVPPGEIQQTLRDIVAQVTDRGPGGHILTGPVFVEGADSGDVLEVKILSVAWRFHTATTDAAGSRATCATELSRRHASSGWTRDG